MLAAWAKELRVVGLSSWIQEFVGSPAERCVVVGAILPYNSHWSTVLPPPREVALRQVYTKGGILLTTYGMVLHNAQQLQACPRSWRRSTDETDDEVDGQRRLWDVMFLDEVSSLCNGVSFFGVVHNHHTRHHNTGTHLEKPQDADLSAHCQHSCNTAHHHHWHPH